MSTLLALAFFLLAAHLYDASWNYLRDREEFSAAFNFVAAIVATLAGLSLL